MAGKKTGYIVTLIVSSCNSQSFETQNSSKTLYKYNGGSCSSKFTDTHKAGGFVDRRNGNRVYKEEANYQSSFKVKNKIQGSTTKYETQVKCKKVTTHAKPVKKVTTYAKPVKKVTTSSNHSKKVTTYSNHSKKVTTYSGKSSGGSRSYGVSKKINH